MVVDDLPKVGDATYPHSVKSARYFSKVSGYRHEPPLLLVASVIIETDE